ncbi:MAG: M48 family metallopeptidase [Sulfuricella sp.]|nr:M48 family metallopeptidase [Sulfuricella sp.]
MNKLFIARLVGLALCLFPAGLAWAAPEQGEGVNVGKPSMFRNLVPAEMLERQAVQQYADLKRQAAAKNALGADSHSQVVRLRGIADRIIPYAAKFNPRATAWKWEINLIGSSQVNAFCMPGGKIAFYSGLLSKLKLSDDEVAIVMGHEIAHALREHARERLAKSELTSLGASLLGQRIGDGRYAALFEAGGSLLNLKFSRSDESEADLVGLELAARAGFDPRAGVSLWEKMGAASKGAPPQWLSTHPSGQNRIKEIERHLPEVLPLYEHGHNQTIPR